MGQKIHDVVDDLRKRGLGLVVMVQHVKHIKLDLAMDGLPLAEYDEFLSRWVSSFCEGCVCWG